MQGSGDARGGRRCRAGTARLCWVRIGVGGQEFPRNQGSRAEDGAEAGFHNCGQGRRGGHVPLPPSPHCSVWWGWGGQGARVAFRQFELFFPGSGTAAKTQGLPAPPEGSSAHEPSFPPLLHAHQPEPRNPWGHLYGRSGHMLPHRRAWEGVSSWPLGKKCSLPHPSAVDTRPQTLLITGTHRPEGSPAGLRGLFTQQDQDWEIKGGFPGGRRPIPALTHIQGTHRPAPEETWERPRGL